MPDGWRAPRHIVGMMPLDLPMRGITRTIDSPLHRNGVADTVGTGQLDVQRLGHALAAMDTGNVFAAADAMGHEDLKTTRIYQHPESSVIRDAIDERNRMVM